MRVGISCRVITRRKLQDMLMFVVLLIVLLICVWRLLRVPFLTERVAFICRYCAWRLELNWFLPNLRGFIVLDCDSGYFHVLAPLCVYDYCT